MDKCRQLFHTLRLILCAYHLPLDCFNSMCQLGSKRLNIGFAIYDDDDDYYYYYGYSYITSTLFLHNTMVPLASGAQGKWT